MLCVSYFVVAVSAEIARPWASIAVSCAVVASVDSKRIRILLDTEAVRSMIRTSVAQQFLSRDETKGACGQPQALTEPEPPDNLFDIAVGNKVALGAFG